MDSTHAVPTIKALRAKADAIRDTEVQRAYAKLGEGADVHKQRQVVQEVSRAIVNKLLHAPISALRCDAAPAGGGDDQGGPSGASADSIERVIRSMEAVESVFGLDVQQLMLDEALAAARGARGAGGEAAAAAQQPAATRR